MRLFAVVSFLLFVACGGSSSESANPHATATRIVELTQVAHALAPTVTPDPTNTASPTHTATPTAEPTPTPTPEPTDTPDPTATPVSTATPELTATPSPTKTPLPTATPTSTPEPALPLSEYQPREGEFGARYIFDNVATIEVPAWERGFISGDRIQYFITEADFLMGPLFLQLSCAQYDHPNDARAWISNSRSNARRLLSNVQNDEEVETSADGMYRMSGLWSGSSGGVYRMSLVWFQIGHTSCEYQSLDEDDAFIQFMNDIAIRVVSRLRPT